MAEPVGFGAYMFAGPSFIKIAASYAKAIEELGFDDLWIEVIPHFKR